MPVTNTDNVVVAFIREHMALAEPAVFFMGFAEGVPLLSLFVPSTPLFLGIGAAHAAAGGQFWQLWIAASVGSILSDLLVYALGRAAGTRQPEQLEQGVEFDQFAGERKTGVGHQKFQNCLADRMVTNARPLRPPHGGF